MFDLDPAKLLVVLVVALLVLGPEKLPKYARQAGSMLHELKNLKDRFENEVRSAVPDLPSSAQLTHVVRNPISFLSQLGEEGAPVAAGELAVSSQGSDPEEAEGATAATAATVHPQEPSGAEPSSLVVAPSKGSSDGFFKGLESPGLNGALWSRRPWPGAQPEVSPSELGLEGLVWVPGDPTMN